MTPLALPVYPFNISRDYAPRADFAPGGNPLAIEATVNHIVISVIGRDCAVICRDRREVNATFEFAVAYLKTIFTDTIKDSRYPWSIHTVSGGRILFRRWT